MQVKRIIVLLEYYKIVRICIMQFFLPRCRKPKKKKNLLVYCRKMVCVAGVLNQTFGEISSLKYIFNHSTFIYFSKGSPKV